MCAETQLRAAMAEAGVDFLDGGKTLWADIQSHEDGYTSMAILERLSDDDPLDPAFRISRAFLVDGKAHIKIDGELSGMGLAEIDDQFRSSKSASTGRSQRCWRAVDASALRAAGRDRTSLRRDQLVVIEDHDLVIT